MAYKGIFLVFLSSAADIVMLRPSVTNTSVTSDPRQEYRPWTGVRPAKSTRRNPPGQYSSPGTQASRAPPETSYQAAYSGEAQRPMALHEGENAIPTASDNIQPIPAEALQASLSTSGPQLSAGGSTKGEVSTFVQLRV